MKTSKLVAKAVLSFRPVAPLATDAHAVDAMMKGDAMQKDQPAQ